jgi:hypothetical protein
MTKRLRHVLAALGLFAFAEGVAASPLQAVVELFTSQGCSSCPPADEAMAELSSRPGLLALTMPVDYWDYLGWKDTLAQPAFSARQRAYAKLRGDRQVYTPQMVVNGSKPCIGSDRVQVDRAIAVTTAGQQGLPAAVAISEKDGIVALEVDGSSPRAAGVWVLPIVKSQTVQIGRGENGGRKITYTNVVRGMMRVGEWTGGKARFEVPLATAKGDGDGYVVLIQTAEGSKPGPIIGAARSAP